MDEPNKSQFFADLRDLIVTYFQERLELAKALAYEKIARNYCLLVYWLADDFVFLFWNPIPKLYAGDLFR